ncbi:Protein of unknown function [Gryllus bimaculatus]|nr:Protein of unknown function [Gryllus bimaculatus]
MPLGAENTIKYMELNVRDKKSDPIKVFDIKSTKKKNGSNFKILAHLESEEPTNIANCSKFVERYQFTKNYDHAMLCLYNLFSLNPALLPFFTRNLCSDIFLKHCLKISICERTLQIAKSAMWVINQPLSYYFRSIVYKMYYNKLVKDNKGATSYILFVKLFHNNMQYLNCSTGNMIVLFNKKQLKKLIPKDIFHPPLIFNFIFKIFIIKQ